MAFAKNAGRQYPLVAVQTVDYTGYTSGVALDAVELPIGARVLGVNFYTDTAWNTGTTAVLKVGDANAANRYINDQDIKTTGSEPATQAVGYRYASGGNIKVTITDTGTAPTAGSGVLVVQYVVEGRANDVQA